MDKRVNIAFLVSSLADMGGSVRVAVQLANKMCLEYSVYFFEMSTRGECFFPLDKKVSRISLDLTSEKIKDKIKDARIPLRDFLQKEGIDILMGIGIDESCAAVLPCLEAHVSLVFCDHGALINEIEKKKTTFLRKMLAKASRRVVVLTETSKHDYEEIFHSHADKIIWIPNWIPNNLQERALRYNTYSKKILWAGRLDEEKGIDLLFEVAQKVLPLHPDWVWDVYGDKVLYTGDFDLEEAIAGSDLVGQLNLCGRVDNLYERYRDYSIGTLTSYREGLPLFLLETKACAIPSISFDVNTGPRDIIEDGTDGFLVTCYDCDEYAKKLCLMIEDAQLRCEMSYASQRNIEKFSENQVYMQWQQLIFSLKSKQ